MNLTMLLDMARSGFADRIVIGRNQDGLTAAELDQMATVGAQIVRDSGADSIVYLAVNGPAFPVALFAGARAGVPMVPLNYRLGADQLTGLLARHQHALVIGEGQMVDALQSEGRTVMSPAQWLERTGSAEPEPDFETVDRDEPAVIIYTSGTTSEPKGVLLRHENLTSYVFNSVEFAAADDSDAALVSVPPYHIAAVANVISNLYAGRRTIVLEQFEAAEWLETVRTERVTNALVVPTMLARILQVDGDKSVPSLRNLAYGGAPMSGAVIEHALELWPEIGFVNAYGLTETSSTIAVLSPEDHRAAAASSDPAARSRLKSVGKVLPSVEVSILDLDGTELPPGVPGRICVRGDQVSAEYAGIGKLVDEQGYFDTRDQGYLDEEGFLFIGGRTDDTIIRGAENIAPAEIEDVMFRHPAIDDVAVVGVPDEQWGQRIEAVVVLREGAVATAKELREYVRSVLRSSKTPDHIYFEDELPRTETGKLLRRRVLAQIID